ncbi:MAG: Protein translocase subunit SecA [Chlamydiae bacterium]|nr:Protein translocase subunit SecA [Chlamydiota bacterium]
MFGFLKKLFGTAQDRVVRSYSKLVAKVNEWDEKYKALSDDELRAKTDEFRDRLNQGEPLDDLTPEAFAVVKNVCRRLMGSEVHVSGYNQEWDMTPYDVQIVGAVALHKGSIAEMKTGEGKTVTAVMPLYLNALTGKPVHLVTVNDYLAKRDCEWVGSVLRWLGLTTAALTNGTPMEDRKSIYEADVVYGTASEFGFDYLRDNSMASRKEEQVQRGYYYAIIDEVDSILIDEARTPLIISGPVPVSRQMYDELKGGVGELVRRQRDFCNRLASEARKVLDLSDRTTVVEKPKDKQQEEAEQEALRKLWLVSKGTPRNKILKRVKENPDLRAAIDNWDLYYYSDANKEERAQKLAELYMVVDEKSNEYELTDRGIAGWEECSSGVGKSDDFVMFDISYEYLKIDEDPNLSTDEKMERKLAIQEEDAKRKERAHNLRQLLRAHLLMERDVDYIVQEDKIVIIDENTGRPQPGRRFADGLHQSIEAKEGVSIQKETQTYATITLQNFFRMYEKRAGMTGTAITEAGEFKQIYDMDVLEIPTNRPCIRKDYNDEIYMTEREKYNAILKDVSEVHGQGRPILIGTESVEVSEKLSRIFKQNKLTHTVLNAKNHEREAEIVAHAGRRGSITIATNMAGRGTDIKLEEGIAGLGGLYVVGTTRHQSRRTDRQLRGRCARQGDPGFSKFFVSFEDSLLRLFASPRMTGILQKFRPPEGEPISAKILNKSIETAQKRVEQRNYTMRKHTLEYDDVMNKQRQEIYTFRNEVLHTDDIESIAIEFIENVCMDAAEDYFRSRSEEGGWDPEGYRQWLMRHFPVSFDEGFFDDDHSDAEELVQKGLDKVIEAFRERLAFENAKVEQIPPSEVEIPAKPANEALRHIMIQKIDKYWQEHLLNMDHLRSDVNLRAVGQRDPLMEFKHEAFHHFDLFGQKIRKEITRDLFRFEIRTPEQPGIEQLLSRLQMERNRSFLTDLGESTPQLPGSGASTTSIEPPQAPEQVDEKSQPVSVLPKVGRNDPCPCGSGKKYKKCCGVMKSEHE